MADVELQDLALDLDRADQYPDLLLAKALGVRIRQFFELFGHRRMLVGGKLKPEPRLLPCSVQSTVFFEWR